MLRPLKTLELAVTSSVSAGSGLVLAPGTVLSFASGWDLSSGSVISGFLTFTVVDLPQLFLTQRMMIFEPFGPVTLTEVTLMPLEVPRHVRIASPATAFGCS